MNTYAGSLGGRRCFGMVEICRDQRKDPSEISEMRNTGFSK